MKAMTAENECGKQKSKLNQLYFQQKPNGPTPSSTRGCRDGSTGCFKCVQICHFMRECLKKRKGSDNGGNRAQFSSITLPDRAIPRGATSMTDKEKIVCMLLLAAKSNLIHLTLSL
ncbi:hypothetical protein H5410_002645, partial [Solanum commersonii]